MKFLCFLRGINVGGNHLVKMSELRAIFESLGFTNVQTYINSGNVVFEANKPPQSKSIEKALSQYFHFNIPTLVLDEPKYSEITKNIPLHWLNNETHKCDVAFLFEEIDKAETLALLPIEKENIQLVYTPGAIIWHFERKYQNQINLDKLVTSKFYQSMTIRNINTVRKLIKLIS